MKASELKTLRDAGVKLYRDDKVTVEFFPAVAPQEAGDLKLPAAEEPTCRCGHEHARHVGGLCLEGCAVEKCAPPEAA